MSTDAPIWSEKFSGTTEDVFGIQEEISRQIVSALEVKLSDSEERNVTERPIDDPVAYDCYLRARQLMYHWTPEGHRRALKLVDEALAIAGDAPLLLATAGQVHWNMVNFNIAPASEGLGRAAEYVERALALDKGSSLAIFVRGLVAGMRGQAEDALVDLYRAHELRPGDSNVLTELLRFSHASGLRNHWRYVQELTETDPLSPQTPLLEGMYHWLFGPRPSAAAPARRGIELAPVPSMVHIMAAWLIAQAGHREESVAVLERVQAETGGVLESLARFLTHALAGNADAAMALMTPDLVQAVTNEFVCKVAAEACALLGRTQETLTWLRRAVDGGFINHPNLSVHDDGLTSVRDMPEFQALLTEIEPRWRYVVDWEQGLRT